MDFDPKSIIAGIILGGSIAICALGYMSGRRKKQATLKAFDAVLSRNRVHFATVQDFAKHMDGTDPIDVKERLDELVRSKLLVSEQVGHETVYRKPGSPNLAEYQATAPRTA